MPTAARKALWRALQVAFLVVALWYAATALGRQWDAFGERLALVRLDWGPIVLSAALVLSAYVLLVQTWRIMLLGWGGKLGFWPAARIWFVSNLGKYVPGKIWQIAAMSVMAQKQGVSPVAATGSSLVVNLANILSGLVIVLTASAGLLALPAGGSRVAVVVAVALAALFLLLPLLPRVAVAVAQMLGRSIAVPAIPHRAIWAAALGTAVAWVLYGTAFEQLGRGLLGLPGPLLRYVAVYALSYLAGYLTPLAPGGLVVRETVLAESLVRLGLNSEADAWLLALGSRIWLTVLEILPALVFLGVRSRDSRE